VFHGERSKDLPSPKPSFHGERHLAGSHTPPTEHARQLLRQGLDALRLEATPEQLDRLLRLGILLDRWARQINLTGHRDLDTIVRRLLLDACAFLAQLPGSLGGLADLGSGAGFPGLPVAILRPDWKVTLVEARRRRHHFQRAAVRELGIPNAEPLEGRIEELAPRPHPGVVAQALAPPEEALPLMLPWAEPGGVLLLPGSHPGPEIPEIDGVLFQERIEYRVPCEGPLRTLWIGRRSCGTR
jgi:16S rRNA (guanine527-N7)-methyltransferase